MSQDSIRISFVRHGQTESNLAKRWQGQGDSQLSRLGREQARLLGARLKLRKYSHVLSSDLSRAMDTARATGFEFSVDPVLREFDIGSWEGLTSEQVAAQYPEQLARLTAGEDVALGGGESYSAFCTRIDGALAALRARLAPGDHALVVCHGGVIATALSGLLGLRKTRSWSSARAANTSITEFSFSAQRTLLHVFNDTLHLRPLGRWPAHGELASSVALLHDVPLQHEFGEFAARYDDDTEAALERLSARLVELSQKHPEERVALSASARSIHAWAESVLFADNVADNVPAGGLMAPPRASVSHVGRVAERPLLLDYGVGSW